MGVPESGILTKFRKISAGLCTKPNPLALFCVVTSVDLAYIITETDDSVPCSEQPELWFAEHPADLEEAKRACAVCPLKAQCLAGALARREPWGVWGGEIVVDGTVRSRKRRRGRPRSIGGMRVA